MFFLGPNVQSFQVGIEIVMNVLYMVVLLKSAGEKAWETLPELAWHGGDVLEC